MYTKVLILLVILLPIIRKGSIKKKKNQLIETVFKISKTYLIKSKYERMLNIKPLR